MAKLIRLISIIPPRILTIVLQASLAPILMYCVQSLFRRTYILTRIFYSWIFFGPQNSVWTFVRINWVIVGQSSFLKMNLAFSSFTKQRSLNGVPFHRLSIIVNGLGKSYFNLLFNLHHLLHCIRSCEGVFFHEEELSGKWVCDLLINKWNIVSDLLIVDLVVLGFVILVLLFVLLHH